MRATAAQLFAYTHARTYTFTYVARATLTSRCMQTIAARATNCAATAGTPFSCVARYVAWFAYIPGVVSNVFSSFSFFLLPLLLVTANYARNNDSGDRTSAECLVRSDSWDRLRLRVKIDRVNRGLAGSRLISRRENFFSSLNSLCKHS